MSYVLGVNLSHDRSAALVRDGEVVVAIEEERLDRIKHSEGFLIQGHFERLTKTIPMKAIAYCLDAAGIGIDEVDLVVGNRPLGDGAVWRLLRELPIKDKSRIRELPFPSHHLAHAVTAFYCSPFDEAAVLVIDQAGSRDAEGRIEKHTAFHGTGTAVERVAGTTYPVDYTDLSLGLFYDFFTVKLGFLTRYGTTDFGVFGCGGYPEAGKTMGLAPYGRPRPEWGEWLTIDGFDVTVSQDDLEQVWKDIVAAEDGDVLTLDRPLWQSRFAKDVAYKVQDELERAVLHLVDETRRRTGSQRLCVAGGIMLNSVANQRIRAEGPFEEVFIPAPAGDSGVAVGAALYGWHQLLGGTARRGEMRSAALGRDYPRARVERALRPYDGRLEWREADVSEVARLISEGEIVGWFQGRSEMGPRALGHRSILADPRQSAHPRLSERDGQAPGAVPAVCAVGAGRARVGVVRLRRGEPVHAAGAGGAGGPAAARPGDHPRRRQCPGADRGPRGRAGLPPADQRVPPAHRRTAGAQHVLQRQRRADRGDAGGRAAHVRPDRARPPLSGRSAGQQDRPGAAGGPPREQLGAAAWQPQEPRRRSRTRSGTGTSGQAYGRTPAGSWRSRTTSTRRSFRSSWCRTSTTP
jgi:carbamoyltransferase